MLPTWMSTWISTRRRILQSTNTHLGIALAFAEGLHEGTHLRSLVRLRFGRILYPIRHEVFAVLLAKLLQQIHVALPHLAAVAIKSLHGHADLLFSQDVEDGVRGSVRPVLDVIRVRVLELELGMEGRNLKRRVQLVVHKHAILQHVVHLQEGLEVVGKQIGADDQRRPGLVLPYEAFRQRARQDLHLIGSTHHADLEVAQLVRAVREWTQVESDDAVLQPAQRAFGIRQILVHGLSQRPRSGAARLCRFVGVGLQRR
mmetsp:Transcript_15668/g.43284  ORF Transcript_15668/g.43284 Transcript_15668/m.43284 type:complete len:258 (+) Transcript_15668:411-1184(+)